VSGAALLAAACVAAVPLLPGPGWARARVERLVHLPVATVAAASTQAAPQGSSAARASALLAGLAVWQLVGGVAGVVTGGLTVLALTLWLRRLEPAQVRAERARLLADLPVTLDLLAGCLGAGASPQRALAEAADAVGGPLGLRLAGVAAHVRLGADPTLAWAELSDVPAIASLVRSITRSLNSGAAWRPTLERAARDLRARRRVAGDAAARAVAVKAVAPLGACFLPAFVLLGVVPTIWGIAGATFTGGL
jgi:Flp pilus assembly protein TadB